MVATVHDVIVALPHPAHRKQLLPWQASNDGLPPDVSLQLGSSWFVSRHVMNTLAPAHIEIC
jgi:hypothetical protein